MACVWIDDTDIGKLDEDGLVTLRRRIGMIFQHFNLMSAKTVFDNVALPLRVAGVRRTEIEARVNDLLATSRPRGQGPGLSGNAVGRTEAARGYCACAGTPSGNPVVRRSDFGA